MTVNMSCLVHIKCTSLGQPFYHQQHSLRWKICIVFLSNHKFTTHSENACLCVHLTPTCCRMWLWLILYALFFYRRWQKREDGNVGWWRGVTFTNLALDGYLHSKGGRYCSRAAELLGGYSLIESYATRNSPICMRPDGSTMSCVYASVRVHARVHSIRAQGSFHTSMWTCRRVTNSSCYNESRVSILEAFTWIFSTHQTQNRYMSTPHSMCMGVKNTSYVASLPRLYFRCQSNEIDDFNTMFINKYNFIHLFAWVYW
jgi:hypothetical protein